MKRERPKHSHLSVGDILGDDLTVISLKNWAGDDCDPYSEALVKKLYKEQLMIDDLSRVQLLETSKYLEAYLWPNLTSKVCREHLMSTIVMINEKFRERSTVFDFLTSGEHARQKISEFFSRICDAEWVRNESLNLKEMTAFVRFLVGCFQNLAHEFVRVELLKLVHLPLWDAVSARRIELELSQAPRSVQKQWRMFQKQKEKGKSFVRETNFFPFLFGLFFDKLNQTAPQTDGDVLFVQRFIELCIDLLSQLPTRRYFKLFVEDKLLLARLKLSKVIQEAPLLTAKMVQMLKFYQEFEVDEFTGMALKSEDVTRAHNSRIARLQMFAFKNLSNTGNQNVLKEFAISNVGAISSRMTLERHLNQLDDATLFALASQVGISVEENSNRALIQEGLLLHCQARTSQIESINRIPLYPTESLMWDDSIIPSENYTGLAPLALPKLNLQFLTFYDYLLRNYNLYRLESAYDLRNDVENVITRMSPKKLTDGKVKFEGWARMALPVRSTKITSVGDPLLGDTRPSHVKMEVLFSIHHFKGELREEWEAVKQHDVLFMMQMVDPSDFKGENLDLAQQAGLKYFRGCEVLEVWDEQGNKIRAKEQRRYGDLRRLVVSLDTAQYQMDVLDAKQHIYSSFNLLMRRDGAENTFKGVLETVRSLINTESLTVPPWLNDVFLGYGNPKNATPDHTKLIDYADTFLDDDHVRECFPNARVEFQQQIKPAHAEMPLQYKIQVNEDGSVVKVHPYDRIDMGPFPEDLPRTNKVRYTPRQVEAVGNGAKEGLTLIVGPPGTGKTDTAVQILSLIYRQNPNQRTLMLTHSNAALNQIFEKLIGLDIDPSQMVRMGHGEKHLDSTESFSQEGRVNFLLARRLRLLSEVERLSHSLGLNPGVEYTCETAQHFYFEHVVSRWEKFLHDASLNISDKSWVSVHFPFSVYFAMAPRQPLFKKDETDIESAKACYRHLDRIFTQLQECRPLEVMRNSIERGVYVLIKHSRIVAMTVTFAALMRQNLVKAGFRFDSVVMEEAGQVKEIESFIPLLMQEQAHTEDRFRLKRVVLIGDDNQLPPVVKNAAFERYSNLDQSLFARLIRLCVPSVLLDKQGRARPELAKLFNWRYPGLGDLPRVHAPEYKIANPGFRWEYQLIDVGDYQGVGEFCPKSHFFQNLGEAEYAVATYMYMRSLGYPSKSITILTTYKGQKHLIRDILQRRCANLAQFGLPNKVLTVDKYQGQQSDYILLSLVRTKTVGHIRDVRRLIVAMSRARFGLYVFCRQSLFQNCYELTPVFQHLIERPNKLQLVTGEKYDSQISRKVDEEVVLEKVKQIDSIIEMGKFASVNFSFDYVPAKVVSGVNTTVPEAQPKKMKK